jgi:hypothetical protein
MPTSTTVEGYPEVVALADALKQVLAPDDAVVVLARVWGVLRGIRGEAGVRWAADVLTGDATLKKRLLEDLHGFAEQFAALHRTQRETHSHGGAHVTEWHHKGSGPLWLEAFNTARGVHDFERATSAMAKVLEKRCCLQSDDIVGMIEALEGVFPLYLKKKKSGNPCLLNYGA